MPQPLQLIRRNRLRRSVDDLTRLDRYDIPRGASHASFRSLPRRLRTRNDPGIDEIAEYRDFSMRGTIPTNCAYSGNWKGWWKSAPPSYTSVSGTRAWRWGSHPRGDTLTASRSGAEEVDRASAFVIPNYRVMLVNKYNSALPFTLRRAYDFIIDNNPSTFACCKRHFFAMLASTVRLLNPGGYLLTDRQDLGCRSARTMTPR